jgi:hypothetical protein
MVAEPAEDLEELRWHALHVQARLGALRPLPDGPAASVRADLERRVAALGRALDADPDPGAPGAPGGSIRVAWWLVVRHATIFVP